MSSMPPSCEARRRPAIPARESRIAPDGGTNGLVDFAQALKERRASRRLSQLELALKAGTTQRHLSFIESGRSVPGRPMVIRLTESLGLPLRERNELLLRAGYAPAYPQQPLDSAALAPVMDAPRIANFPEWARHVLHGLEAELDRTHAAGDDPLAVLYQELASYVPPARLPPGHLGFAVPLELRTARGELRLITTITSFATAADVTVSELRLEAFLPADAATAAALAGHAKLAP